MQQWKLPSQLVTTDRKENETDYNFLYRHEHMRRITAEIDLINCLDFIESLCDGKNEVSPKTFIIKFLDKTINN